MPRSNKIAAPCLFLLLALSACTKAPVDISCRDCNLLLFSIDTLRADRLPSYGYARNTAPNFSALAGRSILFGNVFSASYVTMQSHMTAFTGLYPNHHGLLCRDTKKEGELYCGGRNVKLRAGVSTLPQLLKAAGYGTSFFAGAPEPAMFPPEAGFSAGIDQLERRSLMGELDVDQFLERLPKEGKFYAFAHTWAVHSPYQVPKSEEHFTKGEYAGGVPASLEDFASHRQACKREGIRKCLRRLYSKNGWSAQDENTLAAGSSELGLLGRPLQLAMMRKGNRDDIERFRDMYDNSVRFADKLLGRLVRGLEERGLMGKTVIIVFSDHGDGLFEWHDVFGHGSFHEEITHVPLLVYHPRLKGGQKDMRLASLVDVMPTALHALGLQAPATDGKSLLPPGGKGHEQVFGYAFRPHFDGITAYVRTTESKVILSDGGLNLAYHQLGGGSGKKESVVKEPTKELFRMETLLRSFTSEGLE